MFEESENPESSNPEMNSGDSAGCGTTPQNRTNSPSLVRRGGGPRTAEGKERSKRNALKYGIFSKVAVLKGESRVEFDALLTGLNHDFQPVGTFEEGLVEMLAVTRWRQRRVFIAEAADIEMGTQSVEWDEKQRQKEEADRIFSDPDNRGLIRGIANIEVIDTCLKLLAALKQGIDARGLDQTEDMIVLTHIYGEENKYCRFNLLYVYHLIIVESSLSDEIRAKGNFPSSQQCKIDFLVALVKEIRRLSSYRSERESTQSNRMRLESLRRNVPDSPRLDQLLRSLASLERSFGRTLNELERAQRIRLGQPVLPPVNINVSS